jgi:hypothetical protein
MFALWEMVRLPCKVVGVLRTGVARLNGVEGWHGYGFEPSKFEVGEVWVD